MNTSLEIPRLPSWVLSQNNTLFEIKSTRQTLKITQTHYATNLKKGVDILVVILSDGVYWIPAIVDSKRILNIPELPQGPIEKKMLKLHNMIINISKVMIAVHRRGEALGIHLVIQEYTLAELKSTKQAQDPKEVSVDLDVQSWLEELQNTMPDLSTASIQDLYPYSKENSDEANTFLSTHETIVPGFEYMMVFYYNELTTKKPLKRYISFEEAQEWRKRLKTNTRAQKMSIQDIIQKKSQAWKILIHETLENRSLSFSGEDLAHEGIFLEEDTLDEQTEQTERKQQDERDKQDTRDEQDQLIKTKAPETHIKQQLSSIEGSLHKFTTQGIQMNLINSPKSPLQAVENLTFSGIKIQQPFLEDKSGQTSFFPLTEDDLGCVLPTVFFDSKKQAPPNHSVDSVDSVVVATPAISSREMEETGDFDSGLF